MASKEPKDKSRFIKDPKKDATTREKNMHLSDRLAAGPLVTGKIVRIERIEIGGSGWRIYYRD